MFKGYFEAYKMTIYLILGVLLTAGIGYGVYKINHAFTEKEEQISKLDKTIYDMNTTIYSQQDTINTDRLKLALSEGNVNTLKTALDANNDYIDRLNHTYTTAVSNFEAWKKKTGEGKYTPPVTGLLDSNASNPHSLEEIIQFNKSISELNYEKDL